MFSRFASNRLYLEDRADLKHTVATRRIRLSYPEVLISWQITGICIKCCNLYPPTCREVSGLPQALEKFWKNTFLEFWTCTNAKKCQNDSKCDLLLLFTGVNVKKHDYSWEWRRHHARSPQNSSGGTSRNRAEPRPSTTGLLPYRS